MFWGISEGLDLCEEYLKAFKESATTGDDETTKEEKSAPKSLNILLFGASDPRHIIKTIAKLYTHTNGNAVETMLNIYMLDGCMEIVARNIVLLSIALESAESINLLSKVHLFMDIYGNTLLRPASYQYLVGKSKALLHMLTDSDVLNEVAPLLDINGIKYRERDALENAFKFWQPKNGHVFDIQDYWTMRLRQLLGTRYDHREGAFDWDLNMTLKDREAKQICSQEYRYWRETGIAFTFPEYEQCKPNKTLAVGLVSNGEKYLHRGYVGDIQTGPFCSFGLKTADERMMRSEHGENDYRATDITERNLLELFHELQTRNAYVHDAQLSRKYGCVKLQMGKCLKWNECDADIQTYDKAWLHIDGVQLHLLSADDVFTLQDANGRWCDFFDVVYVGHNYFSFLRESFAAVFRKNALLILETKLWTMLRRDDVKDFETKLLNYAKTCGLKGVINYNALNAKYSILKFRKT